MIGSEMLGVLRTIYINKQMRRYYGKKYDRQTAINKGRRTQKGYVTCESGCDKSRTGQVAS